jgi:hypothetical protein
MNLSDFINKYTGQVIGSGQCGDLVDAYLEQVLNCSTTYTTALDYWTNGIPGFSVVTGDPEAGDIACYNQHPGYPDGHIAIYDGNGEVFEQNADPDGSPAHLFARANTYLLGYLRQEVEVFNQGDAVNISWALYGQKNIPDFVQAQVGTTDFKTAIYNIVSDANNQVYLKANPGDNVNVHNLIPNAPDVTDQPWKSITENIFYPAVKGSEVQQ